MMRSLLRPALLATSLLVLSSPACRKKPELQILGEDARDFVQDVRERPVPDALKARFQIRLKSKPLDLSGTTGGGLQIARPGRGRIVIYGPIGGTLATLEG